MEEVGCAACGRKFDVYTFALKLYKQLLTELSTARSGVFIKQVFGLI